MYKNEKNCILTCTKCITIRDYDERLAAHFKNEIQSTNFGQGTTLSMEGCFVEFHDSCEKLLAYLHSHMSDESIQDEARTCMSSYSC